MQGVESYWDPVGGERSSFCSRISENLEREEEPVLVANVGQWAGLFQVCRALVYMCGGTTSFLLRTKIEI